MYQSSAIRRDLVALGLAAVTVFLGTSLITYDAADPLPYIWSPFRQIYTPDRTVYPLHEEPQNACGLWGALAAQVMFESLGLAAYVAVFILVCLSYRLIRRQTITAPAWRLSGAVAIVVGTSTAMSLLVPTVSAGPWIGGGGYLGMLTCTLLSKRFATTGSLILSGSLIWCGLLLTADLLGLAWSIRAFTRLSGMLWGLVGRLWQVRQQRSQSEKAVEVETDSSGPSVRVRGRKLSTSVDAEPLFGDEEAYVGESESGRAAAADRESTSAARSTSEPDTTAHHRSSADAEPTKDETAQTAEPRIRRRGVADRDEVLSSLDRAAQAGTTKEYQLPSLDLLVRGDDIDYEAQAKEVRRNAKILEQTFLDFGYQVKVVEIETGPVIAQYEVQLEAGLRLSKITSLADDLAIALRVPSVRIVAPIPGKNTVGIEVPNSERQIVRLREVIEESAPKTAKMRIPLFLGKDVSGNPLVVDLSTLPHLLIAGRTGTGKSVCLNAIICSILMTRRPDEVRLLLIDPKMVELSCYGRLPHLMHPVVTDMRKAEAILAWAVDKMEERYALLARAGVRHISSYNQLSEEELMERLQPANDEERQRIPLQLPFIVIIADEMADLMMTAGKEVEQHIIRLAQKSRAVGIHLILATQKPTVDVITGLIKSNLPARISFQVASRTDSRVVLDEMGADKLLGNGDMLFLWPGTSMLLRGQGTFVSDDEIERVVDAVSTGEQEFVHELVNLKVDQPGDNALNRWKERDELYEQAIDIVVREQRGSVSLLQRALGIGYGRAARLIDYMEEDGIVGAYAGQHAREVLLTLEEWERMQAGAASASPSKPPPPPLPRPSHRIRPGANGWDGEEEVEDAPEMAEASMDPHHGAEKVDRQEQEQEVSAVGMQRPPAPASDASHTGPHPRKAQRVKSALRTMLGQNDSPSKTTTRISYEVEQDELGKQTDWDDEPYATSSHSTASGRRQPLNGPLQLARRCRFVSADASESSAADERSDLEANNQSDANNPPLRPVASNGVPQTTRRAKDQASYSAGYDGNDGNGDDQQADQTRDSTSNVPIRTRRRAAK